MTHRSQGSPTWQLWNWQVSLVVCILICGASIGVLAILPWSWRLLLLPLLGHPGRSRVVKDEHSGSRHLHPRLSRTYPTQLTSSAHPPCPRNLLPHCPVLLSVATQSTCLFSWKSANSLGRSPENTARDGELSLSCPRLHPIHLDIALSPRTQKSRPTPSPPDPGVQPHPSSLRPRAPDPSLPPSDPGLQCHLSSSPQK